MLFFFQLDVLDEIWDLVESVSERFLTYSFIQNEKHGLYFEVSANPSFLEYEPCNALKLNFYFT